MDADNNVVSFVIIFFFFLFPTGKPEWGWHSVTGLLGNGVEKERRHQWAQGMAA